MLYGGTAIALRLGHRASVDFDFFTHLRLDRSALGAALPFVAHSTILQDQPDAVSMIVPQGDAEHSHVKVSFFGGITFGRVAEPDATEDGIVIIASAEDLFATKLKVILQRAEAKDYRDIAALLRSGMDLARGLASARALFGRQYQPSESLKALVYFRDGDLQALLEEEKRTLIDAVEDVRDLPNVTIASPNLTPDH